MIWVWIGIGVYFGIGIAAFIVIMLVEFNDRIYSPIRLPDTNEILNVGFMVVLCWGYWLAFIVVVVFGIITDGVWFRSVKQFIINIDSIIIRETLK